MEAKPMVSLGGTLAEAAQSRVGSNKVNFAPAPDSAAPVPICMKRRRVHEELLIADSFWNCWSVLFICNRGIIAQCVG
jgi:hypothetical protein